MNALDVVLFNRRALFDPDFVLQCGGILIGAKSTSVTNRCDKLGIASLSVSDTFATLSTARGACYGGASKQSGGRMEICGGQTDPVTFSRICDSFLIATGGAMVSYGNLAKGIASGAATGGEIWLTLFGGSDGTGGATLNTIYTKLVSATTTVPALSTLTCTSGNELDGHSTELYSFIAYGNTLSTTVINNVDKYSPYSGTNSAAYHVNPFSVSAAGRAIGGNESRMIVVGGTDLSSNFYSTMEEISVSSRAASRSWGTLGVAKSDMGMSGSQFRQIISNGRTGFVSANNARDYFNMDSHTLTSQYNNTGFTGSNYAFDSGSN